MRTDWKPMGEPLRTGRPLTTQRMEYTVVPMFPVSDPRHGLSNGPTGSAGGYGVTYVLAVPGVNVNQESVDFDRLEERGDSLFEVEPNDGDLVFNVGGQDTSDPAFLIAGTVNDRNHLRTLSHEVQANGFSDAAAKSYDVMMPLLSRWAFEHDAPITVSGVELWELATDAQKWIHTFVGATKRFAPVTGYVTDPVKHALGSYREGLSSSEPLYQALSFYKVSEMVFQLRAHARKAAGGSYRDPGERVPTALAEFLHPFDLQMYGNTFAPYLGKKFTAVRDELKSTLRNSIAHLDPDRDPFGADSYSDLARVEASIPVLRFMARVLLSSVLDTPADAGQRDWPSSTKF